MYRKHDIRSQVRSKAGDWVAKVVAPDAREYGTFIGPDRESAEAQARAKVDELLAGTWRDLDEDPLSAEELAGREVPSTPARPRRRPLSRFLQGEE
jgi:hypothetical protein